MQAQITRRNDTGRGRLAISRRDGESVHIGDSIVTVMRDKGAVRLLIDAPRSTKILRSELNRR